MTKPPISDLKFGKHYSDHMLEIDWSEEKGWGKPIIKPLEPMVLHPAAKVLHYACEVGRQLLNIFQLFIIISSYDQGS